MNTALTLVTCWYPDVLVVGTDTGGCRLHWVMVVLVGPGGIFLASNVLLKDESYLVNKEHK